MVEQIGIFRESPDSLASLTGHLYYAIVCNGTSAIAGTVAALGRGANWFIPEVSCRSVTQGVIFGGGVPQYYPTTDFAVPSFEGQFEDGLMVGVQPWFTQLVLPSDQEASLIDLSINLSSPSRSSQVAIASLGPGKPGYWSHRGALITVADRDTAIALSSIATVEDAQEEWQLLQPRITSIEVSTDEVDSHFRWLDVAGDLRREQAQRLVQIGVERGWPLVFPPEISGNSVLLPVLLSDQYSIDEVIYSGRLSNAPIGLQPIRPIFSSKVVKSTGFTPSDSLDDSRAKNLVFLAVSAADNADALDRLDAVFSLACP